MSAGESVQQGMLKLLEGAEVEVPVGSQQQKRDGADDDGQHEEYPVHLRRSISGVRGDH